MACRETRRVSNKANLIERLFINLLNLSQLKKPSLRTATTSIYMQAPKALEAATRPNLEKCLSELIDSGEYITVTDAALPVSLQLKVQWTQ